MAEQKRGFGSRDPNEVNFDHGAGRDTPRPYTFGRTARTERIPTDSVPLFLSDSEETPTFADPRNTDKRYAGASYAEEPYQGEQYQDEQYQDQRYQDEPYEDEPYEEEGSFAQGLAHPLRGYRRAKVSFRILMAVLAATAVAMLFALFSSDSTRNFVESAKALITSSSAVPPAVAETEPSSQLSAQDMQLKDPARASALSAPASPAADSSSDNSRVAAAPSRNDIASAFQNALQNQPSAAAPAPVMTPQMAAPQTAAPPVAPQQVAALPPAAPPMTAPQAFAPQAFAPPQVAAPAPVRRMDPDELSMLMKRAKDLLAAGDFPPARLLLRRAADAQDPNAAFMLAQTYDPQVLGTRDVRNINADPAAARNWYQKAAQFGSADAQRRLGQMQN